MRKVSIITLFMFFNLVVFAISPEEILKKVDDMRAPSDNFSFQLEIIAKKGETSDTQKFDVYVGSTTHTLVKFVYPPQSRGKYFLMNEENLWFYSSNIREPIRITPQQRLLGQVSNGDVARIIYHIDYKPASISVDKIKDKKVIKLVLNAKGNNSAYGQIILWVEDQTNKPIKGEFYTISHKLLKTVNFTKYAEILGAERPVELEIHDELSRNQSSVMKYSNFENKQYPSYYFQKNYLKHLQD